LRSVRVSEAEDDHVDEAVCPTGKVLQDFTFAAAPFFLSDAKAKFASYSQFDTGEHLHKRISVKHRVPLAGEFGPKSVQESAKFDTAQGCVKRVERRTMMKEENGVRSEKLLQDQLGRGDLS
jgi:hypothetical protein